MTTYRIKGMHCTSCERLITDILADEGITVTKISHKNGELRVEQSIDKSKIALLLKNDGYTVE